MSRSVLNASSDNLYKQALSGSQSFNSGGIHGRIFLKMLFGKKISRRQKKSSRQRVNSFVLDIRCDRDEHLIQSVEAQKLDYTFIHFKLQWKIISCLGSSMVQLFSISTKQKTQGQ